MRLPDFGKRYDDLTSAKEKSEKSYLEASLNDFNEFIQELHSGGKKSFSENWKEGGCGVYHTSRDLVGFSHRKENPQYGEQLKRIGHIGPEFQFEINHTVYRVSEEITGEDLKCENLYSKYFVRCLAVGDRGGTKNSCYSYYPDESPTQIQKVKLEPLIRLEILENRCKLYGYYSSGQSPFASEDGIIYPWKKPIINIEINHDKAYKILGEIGFLRNMFLKRDETSSQ